MPAASWTREDGLCVETRIELEMDNGTLEVTAEREELTFYASHRYERDAVHLATMQPDDAERLGLMLLAWAAAKRVTPRVG